MEKISISTEDAQKAKIDELMQQLSSSPKGLSSSEAQKRLQQFGANEISEKKTSPLLVYHHFGMKTQHHETFLKTIQQPLTPLHDGGRTHGRPLQVNHK